MKVWTVANQKGGVGKTTSAVSLGGLLADWGFRVLLVDMDPHGSLTWYFKYDPDSLDQSVYSLFQAAEKKERIDPATLICETGIPGLGLMPAAMALATLDRMLHTLDMVLKSRNHSLPVTIVPTMYDRRTRASVDSLRCLRMDYPNRVWQGMIPVDTNFREASKAGLPPAVFDPKTRGVVAYASLLEALMDKSASEITGEAGA